MIYFLLFSYVSAMQKGKTKIENIILDDSKKTDAIDNVWIGKYHKWKIYSFEEAVQSHRETHHPTMYNLPNVPIKAFIELDMQVRIKYVRIIYIYIKLLLNVIMCF